MMLSVDAGHRPSLPPGRDQFISEPIRMMNECGEALRTDMGFTSCEPEDEHRKLLLGAATVQTRGVLLLRHAINSLLVGKMPGEPGR